MSKHTLSVLVENKPGVLARIAALFSRRGFNIDSLAVGETEYPDVSRMTVVVDVEDLPLEQVTKQLNKLVEVLKVVELEPTSAVQRQVMLIKVRADAATRSQVLEMVQMFRAKVVDVATESLTIEATGTTDKLRALLDVLEPYGVKELVQSGIVAIARDPSPTGACAPPETTPHPTRGTAYSSTRTSTHSHHHHEERPRRWPRCSTTTTPTWRSSRAARSRSSGTAARATPTR